MRNMLEQDRHERNKALHHHTNIESIDQPLRQRTSTIKSKVLTNISIAIQISSATPRISCPVGSDGKQ